MENPTSNLSDPVSHPSFLTLQGLLTTLRKIPGAKKIARLLQRPVTAALLVSLFVLVTIRVKCVCGGMNLRVLPLSKS